MNRADRGGARAERKKIPGICGHLSAWSGGGICTFFTDPPEIYLIVFPLLTDSIRRYGKYK
jgi:hypothetical protein